jgi:hypothetical protein
MKLLAREMRSYEYAIEAALGAWNGGISAMLARGAGDRLARAERASAAPMPATSAALDERREG